MATFGGKRKRARLEVRHETGLIDVAGRYEQSLQLYASPPTEELSLNDFERFAAERLKGIEDTDSIVIEIMISVFITLSQRTTFHLLNFNLVIILKFSILK